MESSADLLSLRDEIEGLTAELAETRRQMSAAIEAGSNASALLSRRNDELADSLARLARTEAEVMRLAHCEADLLAVQGELAQIRASQTWKIGRFMMFPVRLVHKMRGTRR